jgi:hypothetical protein
MFFPARFKEQSGKSGNQSEDAPDGEGRNVMLLRTLVGVIIALHGLVYLLYAGQARRLFELQPGLVWPDGSWAFSKLLGDQAARSLAAVGCLLVAAGFTAGGIAIIVGSAWRCPVIIGSAVFATILILLLWNGKPERLADQGLVAVLINVLILAAGLITRCFDPGSPVRSF